MNKVVLIAGPSGSGKTTITHILARKLNGIPLHLDDLFLGHSYINYNNSLTIAKAGGIIARKVANHEDTIVIAEFLFYKKELRDAFKYDKAILMKTGRDMTSFEETGFDYIVETNNWEVEAEKLAEWLKSLN